MYEIVKVPFPFTDKIAVKRRPALIISSAKYFNARIGKNIMAMITSNTGKELWPNDVVIKYLKPTGLTIASIIRFKLFTLDHELIIDRIGVLHDEDIKIVKMRLKKVLAL